MWRHVTGWIRGRDSSRVLHYEGGGSRTPCTDIVCPMYMRVWDMVKIANDPTETRPVILCEYAFINFEILLYLNFTSITMCSTLPHCYL